jgi:hypothetical protein
MMFSRHGTGIEIGTGMTTQISSPKVFRRFAMSRRIAQFIIVAIVSASLAPLASFAAPQNSPRRARASKLSAGLASSTNSSEVTRVIIQTNGAPTAAQDSAIQSKGGRKRGSFRRHEHGRCRRAAQLTD